MSIDQNVSHPSHYGGKDDPYETIKVIDAWGLDKSFCLGNVIKYISRAGKKDGNSLLQDLMKAQFYLNYEVEKQRRCDNFSNGKIAAMDVTSKEYADLVKYFEAYKALDYKPSSKPASACCDSEKYDCQPDECKACKYSDDNGDADCKDCATRECPDGVCKDSVEYDECLTCSHRDDCGVHTISVPDDVGDAINKVADYFLDSEDDYEIGITDDGALVIAPSDYDWDSMEAGDEECD